MIRIRVEKYFKTHIDKGYLNLSLSILFSALLFLVSILLPLAVDLNLMGYAIHKIAILNLIINFAGFGYFALLLRNLNLPTADPSFMNEARLMILISFIFLFILNLLLSFFSILDLSLFFMLIPVAYLNFLISYSKSIAFIEFSTLIDTFLKPLSLPLSILIVGFYGFNFEFIYSLYILLILAFTLLYLKKPIPFLFPTRVSSLKKKNIINASNLMLVSLIFILYSQSDIILLNYFLSEEEVAFFYLISRICAVLLIIFISIRNKFSPQIAKLIGNHKYKDTLSLLRTIRNRSLLLSIPALFLLVLIAYFLESYIYDYQFQGLYVYVFFCSISYITSSFLSVNEVLFVVTDHVSKLKYLYLAAFLIGISASVGLFYSGFGFKSFVIGHCLAFLVSSFLILIQSRHILKI